MSGRNNVPHRRHHRSANRSPTHLEPYRQLAQLETLMLRADFEAEHHRYMKTHITQELGGVRRARALAHRANDADHVVSQPLRTVGQYLAMRTGMSSSKRGLLCGDGVNVICSVHLISARTRPVPRLPCHQLTFPRVPHTFVFSLFGRYWPSFELMACRRRRRRRRRRNCVVGLLSTPRRYCCSRRCCHRGRGRQEPVLLKHPFFCRPLRRFRGSATDFPGPVPLSWLSELPFAKQFPGRRWRHGEEVF